MIYLIIEEGKHMNSSVKLENDEIADFSSLLRHQNIFQCSKYELGFTPDSAWFNGDSTSIIGQCECPDNMDWDNWEMTCYVSGSGFSGLLRSLNSLHRQEPAMGVWLIALIVVASFFVVLVIACAVKQYIRVTSD